MWTDIRNKYVRGNAELLGTIEVYKRDHEPEQRRQALHDRRPLLPEKHIPKLDAGLEQQLAELMQACPEDADEDLLAAQAKAGY